MRYAILTLLFFISTAAVSAQNHQGALKEFDRLKLEAEAIKEKSLAIQKVLLLPDKADVTAAKKENVNVFRILPREIYDKEVLKIRGGGAFYSFTSQSHDYDTIPQISLEQNKFKVGFSGANYGFLTDLGNVPLSKINQDSAETKFSVNYVPADKISTARIERKKFRDFEVEKRIYDDSLPAVVGNTYLLRAITFDSADTLVALKIFRKDFDGSLIVFWKEIKNFGKPTVVRDDLNVSINNTSFDNSVIGKVRAALRANGFMNVQAQDEGQMIVLRGNVQNDKLVDVIQLVQEISQKPVKNELNKKQ